MKNREMEKQVLSARFMLCIADHARIATVNLPVRFAQSVPCFEFFLTMLFKKFCALVETEDRML